MSLNPFAAPYVPSTLNAAAEPYVPFQKGLLPTPVDVDRLKAMPFFQQRLENFLYTQNRITNMRVDALQILLVSPPLAAQKKASVVFMGMYGKIPIVYEADRWEDPRTGAFITLK